MMFLCMGLIDRATSLHVRMWRTRLQELLHNILVYRSCGQLICQLPTIELWISGEEGPICSESSFSKCRPRIRADVRRVCLLLGSSQVS